MLNLYQHSFLEVAAVSHHLLLYQITCYSNSYVLNTAIGAFKIPYNSDACIISDCKYRHWTVWHELVELNVNQTPEKDVFRLQHVFLLL